MQIALYKICKKNGFKYKYIGWTPSIKRDLSVQQNLINGTGKEF